MVLAGTVQTYIRLRETQPVNMPVTPSHPSMRGPGRSESVATKIWVFVWVLGLVCHTDKI